MNFFEQFYKIKTGTYTANSANSLTNMYFGSTNTNLTKDQLSAFNTQLISMGLNKPPGIENMIQNFDQVDSDNDGKLTHEEIQAYLVNNGFISQTSSSLKPRDLLLKVIASLTGTQNNTRFY